MFRITMKNVRTARRVAVLAVPCVLALALPAAHAAGGGTVAGKITLKGTPPPTPPPVKVGANPEKCGTEQAGEALVGPDGSVRWAVVRIAAKGEFPAPAEPPTLDQRGCKFSPRVVVVPAGQTLKVLNSDGILHNVHTFPEKNAALNVAQPGFRKTMDATFPKPETIRVGCDVHPWMVAHVVVTETPFVAVTDQNGAFSISGVPAGTYTVSIWHESLGEQTQQITVAEGKKTDLSVQMASK